MPVVFPEFATQHTITPGKARSRATLLFPQILIIVVSKLIVLQEIFVSITSPFKIGTVLSGLFLFSQTNF